MNVLGEFDPGSGTVSSINRTAALPWMPRAGNLTIERFLQFAQLSVMAGDPGGRPGRGPASGCAGLAVPLHSERPGRLIEPRDRGVFSLLTAARDRPSGEEVEQTGPRHLRARNERCLKLGLRLRQIRDGLRFVGILNAA